MRRPQLHDRMDARASIGLLSRLSSFRSERIGRAIACAFVLLTFSIMPARATPDVQSPAETVRGLIQRLLPGQAKHFAIETIAPDNGADVFEIQSRDDKIVLRGNNGVAIASALNWY